MPATEAHELGLVSQLSKPGLLDRDVTDLAERLAAKPAGALQANVALLRNPQLTLQDALTTEAEHQLRNTRSREGSAARAALRAQRAGR